MTIRKFLKLYSHYKDYYDFTLAKVSYKQAEKQANEEEEWLK